MILVHLTAALCGALAFVAVMWYGPRVARRIDRWRIARAWRKQLADTPAPPPLTDTDVAIVQASLAELSRSRRTWIERYAQDAAAEGIDPGDALLEAQRLADAEIEWGGM